MINRQDPLTLKEALKIGGETESVVNYRNKSRKIDKWFKSNFYSYMDLVHSSSIKRLGDPVCIMKDFESKPGMWIVDDGPITWILFSDGCNKEPWKGTSIEVIVDDKDIDKITDSLERLITFLLK